MRGRYKNSMGFHYELDGVQRVQRLLKEVGPRVHANAERQALRKAARFIVLVVRAKLRQYTFKGQGALIKSIGVKVVVRPKQFQTMVLIGPRKNYRLNRERPVKYAHLVEFGTAPHVIEARKVEVLFARRFGKWSGGYRLGRKILHPGQPARPFIRPAYETGKETALRIYRGALLSELNKAVPGR